MSIDNPLDQAHERLDAEDRASTPKTIKVALATLLSLAGKLGWVTDPRMKIFLERLGKYMEHHDSSKLAYIVDILEAEVRRLDSVIERHVQESDEYRRFLEEDWVPLVAEAVRLAEQARTKEKIERIFAVLGSSLENRVPPEADDVDELMRVALVLNEKDARLLQEIARMQGSAVTGSGDSTVFSKTSWIFANLSQLGLNIDDVFAIGPKLESLGLVRETVESRRGVTVPQPWPYALLPKGAEFLRMARESACEVQRATSAQ